MGRIDVPELEDSQRCPVLLRDALTAYLQVISEATGVFDGAGAVLRRLLDGAESDALDAEAAAARLAAAGGSGEGGKGGGAGAAGGGKGASIGTTALHAAAAASPAPEAPAAAAAAVPPQGRRALVDLCSGGGGALVGLVARGVVGRVDSLTMTDLFPNAAAFASAELRLPSVARGCAAPVDAAAVPRELAGAVRTLFNSLHHLPPPLVARVLADAAASRAPGFAAFEVVGRHPVTVLAVVLQALAVPFVLPFAARRPNVAGKLGRLLVALPAAPFAVAWDGFASCMRAYSMAELRAFAAAASTPDYKFAAREAPSRWLGLKPFRLRWIEGAPVRADGGASRGSSGGGSSGDGEGCVGVDVRVA
ncbi:hypothetical protein Rsub_08922 [Raphidocelis subcapitata]|uniref:Methyltransferase domain-containing protein n=1 Tax=Raphidocelis subcapitata TaxID=307507 RepID=A0A2V0P8I4_9CHLO|nr:hypothetical protein Rsub_08922 [Raphidocelis subcapitata]|eukprot:GBF96174.1 hypothetical protein Rsub_08922 [Raphidocelis subcapitata]